MSFPSFRERDYHGEEEMVKNGGIWGISPFYTQAKLLLFSFVFDDFGQREGEGKRRERKREISEETWGHKILNWDSSRADLGRGEDAPLRLAPVSHVPVA